MNFQLIIAQITGLLQGLLVSSVPDAANVAKEFLSDHKERLRLIESGLFNGDITLDEAKEAMKTEADILFSEIKTFSQIGGQIAQDAVNQVQDIVAGILQPLNEIK